MKQEIIKMLMLLITIKLMISIPLASARIMPEGIENANINSTNNIRTVNKLVEKNVEMVCCDISPVVPNPTHKYVMVNAEACKVPKELLGVHKEIVEDSFCANNSQGIKTTDSIQQRRLVAKKIKGLKVSQIALGNRFRDNRLRDDVATISSVRLAPGAHEGLVELFNGSKNKLDLRKGFSLRVRSRNQTRTLEIKSSDDLWNEIVDKSENSSLRNILRVKTRAIIRASEEGLAFELKNGSTKEIEVLPNQAYEKARKRLKVHFEDVELKEANGKFNYELKTQQRMRLFGIIPVKGEFVADVDAETGDLIKAKKPWFRFFSSIQGQGQERGQERGQEQDSEGLNENSTN